MPITRYDIEPGPERVSENATGHNLVINRCMNDVRKHLGINLL